MIKSNQFIVKEWTIYIHNKDEYETYLRFSNRFWEHADLIRMLKEGKTKEEVAYEISETLVDSREYCGLVRLSDGTSEIHLTSPDMQGSYRRMRVFEDYDELKAKIDELEAWSHD